MRVQMKKIVRQMGCLLCLLLCGLFYTNAAAMEEAVDTEASGTLKVSYIYGTDAESENNLALSGVSFRIYRIASISANGTYSLTDEFAESGLTNDELNSLEYAQDVNAVVDTLVSWLNENSPETETETEKEEPQTEKADAETEDAGSKKEDTELKTEAESVNSILTQTAIAAVQEAVTDATGAAVFENLQTGLYLLVGESLTDGDKLYTNSPSLISIPSLNADETGWEYKVTVNAKAEVTLLAAESESESESETGTMTEPPTEPQTGTTTEPTEPQTGTTPEPTTDPQTELPTETQTEPSTDPQTELPAETQSELPTETQTETSAESSTETVTEPQTETSTESSTETDTELQSETELDAPTGAYVEPLTESSDSLITEYSTDIEVVTETQTESETTDAVQTGDDTPVMTWLVLLCGSCMVLAVCGQQRRKVKKS